MTKNEEILQKAMRTLEENDRKTLEAFAHFLLVSSNSSLTNQSAKNTSMVSTLPLSLVQKANESLLKDYVQLKVDGIEYGSYAGIEIFFNGRDRAQSFPGAWFNISDGILTDRIDTLFVKFRPGSNRIDKVALPAKYLTAEGKAQSKKRILALDLDTNSAKSSSVVLPPPSTASDFVSKLISANNDGWNKTLAEASISVPKSNPIFSKLDSFKEGRLRLSRVGEILFAYLDKANSNKYVWDSEFFFGAAHDFTNVKTKVTYDIKCHFHSGERLQISEQTLSKCDSDFIVSILVEEDDNSYKATVDGFITKADFISKTKPWAYNDYVTLRSLELHELNSPESLFL